MPLRAFSIQMRLCLLTIATSLGRPSIQQSHTCVNFKSYQTKVKLAVHDQRTLKHGLNKQNRLNVGVMVGLNKLNFK